VTTFRSERFQRALIDSQSQDLQMKALSHIILSDITAPKAQCLPFVSLPYMEFWDFIDPLVGLSPHLMSLIASTTQATSGNQQQSATELYAEVNKLQQIVRDVQPADAAMLHHNLVRDALPSMRQMEEVFPGRLWGDGSFDSMALYIALAILAVNKKHVRMMCIRPY